MRQVQATFSKENTSYLPVFKEKCGKFKTFWSEGTKIITSIKINVHQADFWDQNFSPFMSDENTGDGAVHALPVLQFEQL